MEIRALGHMLGTCATLVENRLTARLNLKYITEYILDTNPTNVKFVKEPLLKKDTSMLIWLLI